MSVTDSRGRVGVVGVGEMGRPMIGRLKAAGLDIAAYVRRSEVKADLDSIGIATMPSLQALAAGREFIISYVYTDEQTRQVALDEGLVDAMEPNAILIIHTTGSPKTVQEIAARAEPRGVRVIDAAGAWGPGKVGVGELNLMIGGAPEDVERCRPVLETYAYPLHYMGPLGSGMCMKLINNAVLGAHLQLASEVMRIGRELGLDSYRLLRALTYCTGGSAAMTMMAQAVTEERFWEAGGRFFYKDLTVVYELAEQLQLDLGLIGALNEPLLERLKAENRE